MIQSLWKTAVLSKDRYMQNSDPAISLVGINPIEVSVYVQQKARTRLFIAALIMIAPH